MSTVLGVDPGSRVTGYGVVDRSDAGLQYVASGCIRTEGKDFPSRLKEIYDGLELVVEEYPVDECAFEDVFVAHNPQSALKLGHARGAAMTAVLEHDLKISEYAARVVKQTVAGSGRATKDQVCYMVKSLLHLDGELSSDASDALAVAICHIFHTNAHDWKTRR